MSTRMVTAVCLLAAQCFCAGTGKMAGQKADGTSSLHLSKDTVWEDGFFGVGWRDSVLITNLTNDTLLIDSVHMDSIVSLHRDSAFRSYGTGYLVYIKTSQPAWFPYNNEGGGVFFYPLLQHAVLLKMPPSGSLTIGSVDVKYDNFPTGGVPRTSTGTMDTVLCKLILNGNGFCDTLFIVGIVDVYEDPSQSSMPLRSDRNSVFGEHPFRGAHCSLEGRIVGGRCSETASGLIIGANDPARMTPAIKKGLLR